MLEQLNNRFVHIVKNIKGQGKITDNNIPEDILIKYMKRKTII